MRIVFFSDTFFPDKNGVATAVYHFANLLVRRGQEVMIVAPKPLDWKEEHREQLDPRVRLVFATTIPVKLLSGDGSIGWLRSAQQHLVTEFAPDIVHVHTPSTIGWQGLFFARRRKYPVVLHMHTNYYHPDVWRVIGVSNPLLARLGIVFAWMVTRFYANRAQGLITPTKAFGDMLKKHLTQPIFTIPYPLEGAWYVPPKDLARPLTHQILYVGRLGKEKRVDLALRAFARAVGKLPKLTFRVVGEGMAQKSLKHLAIELGLADKVIFSGGVPRDQVLAQGIYQKADWFLSMSVFETLGYTLIESMAQGTPVLARTCPVNDEVVAGGGKIFDSAEEEKTIQDVADFLVESYDKKDTLSWQKKAREQAVKFSEMAIADNLLATYKKISQRTV